MNFMEYVNNFNKSFTEFDNMFINRPYHLCTTLDEAILAAIVVTSYTVNKENVMHFNTKANYFNTLNL